MIHVTNSPSQSGTKTIRALPDNHDVQLRAKAQALEVSFLAEMLGHAGLGKSSESFGGGVGEDQFASFLRNAQAEKMVRNGGIGLAESIFQALRSRSHD